MKRIGTALTIVFIIAGFAISFFIGHYVSDKSHTESRAAQFDKYISRAIDTIKDKGLSIDGAPEAIASNIWVAHEFCDILVEMMDYADSITAERVKRVIRGYGEGKNAVEGTGGNFSFYDLGEPLLVGDCLNEAVAPEKIREYIWFMETKQPYAPPGGGNPYYLGKHNSTGYYFYYEPQRVTVLDYAFLSTITEKADGTVIYADRCSISEDKLAKMGVTFKKIPRDISRL